MICVYIYRLACAAKTRVRVRRTYMCLWFFLVEERYLGVQGNDIYEIESTDQEHDNKIVAIVDHNFAYSKFVKARDYPKTLPKGQKSSN